MLKYQRLKNDLLEDIKKKKLKPGDRLPGFRDILGRFKVSRNTIHSTLDLLASEGLIEIRHGSGIYLKAPRPDILTVGLVFPEPGSVFLRALLHHLTEKRSQKILDIRVQISYYDPDLERQLVEELRERGAQGVLILAEPSGKNKKFFEKSNLNGFPIVAIARRIEDAGISSVSADHEASGRLAARHLHSRGTTSFGFFGNKRLRTADERFQGFESELKKLGVAPADIHVSHEAEDGTPESGKKIFKNFLTEHPSVNGVFAYHDLYAAGILQHLRAAHIQVPEMVRVLGCDNLDFSSWTSPALSTVDYDLPRLAAESIRLVEEKLKKPGTTAEHVVLAPRLVQRESS